MTARTIKELSSLDARVYVYLPKVEIAEQFMRDAEAEGFTFRDGAKPTERTADSIMAVNSDGTLNYVGFVGHVAFGSGTRMIGDKLLLRVDYAKFRSGDEDYFFKRGNKVSQKSRQKEGLIIDYFSSGAVRSVAVQWEEINGYPKSLGFIFYETGELRGAGILQRGGLYQGKEFYQSGRLKFVGQYNERETGEYYGPPYPVEGKFYSEDGKLLYDGRFHIGKQGGVGYPRVILPEGYGKLF